MTDLIEIKSLIDDQGKAFEEFKKTQVTRLSILEKETGDLLKKSGRPPMGMGMFDGTTPDTPKASFYDVKSKNRVPCLEHKDSLAAQQTKTNGAPSFGRLLRGIVLGNRADDALELSEERKALGIGSDASGGYAAGSELSANFIDALRAKMVLSQAGAITIPMQGKDLTLAKTLTDPTSYWHPENASLTDSEPTFGAVNLVAKTVVTLVKLSLELGQDSANIEQMLRTSLTNSMAAAIDNAGLNGVTLNGAAAPSGLFNLSGRNTVLSIGAPTTWDFVTDSMYELMLDNVALENIGALIAHPALYKKMRKLKTGIASDNTSLVAPDEVRALPKLWTTAAPLASGTTAKAIIADWRSLLFGVRQDINVRVLTETFMGSNLQVGLLCYARVDFAATNAAAFCTMEGITV